uniref:Uncharacterized protein n=1 Tax=Arion vulgaris TaxID=1028688 RepID=A0A0B7AAK5_9EUPU
MKFIKEQQIQLYGHLTRIPWYRLPKRATQKKYDNEAKERSCKRWNDDIKTNRREMSISLQHALNNQFVCYVVD